MKGPSNVVEETLLQPGSDALWIKARMSSSRLAEASPVAIKEPGRATGGHARMMAKSA
jgi:hypothetical protein